MKGHVIVSTQPKRFTRWVLQVPFFAGSVFCGFHLFEYYTTATTAVWFQKADRLQSTQVYSRKAPIYSSSQARRFGTGCKIVNPGVKHDLPHLLILERALVHSDDLQELSLKSSCDIMTMQLGTLLAPSPFWIVYALQWALLFHYVLRFQAAKLPC